MDGGKKVKGRKRHIVVDTLGNLIQVIVHAANIRDIKADCEVLKRARQEYASIKAFSGDAGYRGSSVDFVDNELGVKLHISKNKGRFRCTTYTLHCGTNLCMAW